jgi:hypothetical protein
MFRRLRLKSPTTLFLLPPLLLSAGLVLGTTPADAQTQTVDYLRNGNFEKGGAGWEAGTANTKLTIVSTSNGKVAQLTTGTTGDVVITDHPVAVKAAAKGQVFSATASLRSTQAGQTGLLVIKQTKVGTPAFYTSVPFTAATTWARVTVSAKARSAGSLMEVRLRAVKLRPSQRFLIDNVRMQSTVVTAPAPTPTPTTPTPTTPAPTTPAPTTPAPTTPAPTTPAPTTPAPTTPAPTTPAPTTPAPTTPAAGTLTNGCAYSTRGIPSCGALLGSAFGGNADPTAWETSMGHALGVHRTYYGAGGVASAVSTATKDLANHRIPWISFKLPYSWTDMADGKGDAWAKDLATKLKALNGPVWVAFHHEPEGDGDITEWTRMQAHLAPLVRGAAPNVAFTIVLTGYHQIYGAAQYHLDALWPQNTKVDLVGFDIYNQYGVVKDGVTNLKGTDLLKQYFTPISAWAKAHGVAWGLGETGYTDKAAVDDPQWVSRTYQQLVANGGVAFAYFNTNLNSIANWELSTALKKNQFTAAIKSTPTLR